MRLASVVVEVVVYRSSGVPGSGSLFAQAESHTLTLACAAFDDSVSDVSERGCPVRWRSHIRSVLDVQLVGPGAIRCMAKFSIDIVCGGGVSSWAT